MRAVFLSVLMAILFFSGCTMWPFSSPRPAGAGPYKDIPVPQEMTINEDSINIYETTDGRLGFLKAEGRIKAVAVIYYYREAMAQNGWTLDSEFDQEFRHMMVFRKHKRSAVITINDGWVYTGLEINVNRNKEK